MVSVERRAAVHAALGEPVRLAIVDRLGPGDASPGELAEAVGLGSNLLAHHLKVLEEAGVIRRVRSEGDRRRSYVQLCLDDPVVWAAAQAGLATGCRGRCGAAGGVRVHRELGALAVGGRPVERDQPGPGRVGRHPPRGAGAPAGDHDRPPARAATWAG